MISYNNQYYNYVDYFINMFKYYILYRSPHERNRGNNYNKFKLIYTEHIIQYFQHVVKGKRDVDGNIIYLKSNNVDMNSSIHHKFIVFYFKINRG